MFPNAPDFLEAVTGTWNQFGIYVRRATVQYNDQRNLIRGGALSWWVHSWQGGTLTLNGLYASTAASCNFDHRYSQTMQLDGVTFSSLYAISSAVGLEQIAKGKWAVVADMTINFDDCSARW